jgi:hypothetical protein
LDVELALGAGVTRGGSTESAIHVVPVRMRPAVSGVSTIPNAFLTGRLLRNLPLSFIKIWFRMRKEIGRGPVYWGKITF